MLEKLAEKMEEEVLDKYKVEDSRRAAHRGRGAPLEWRRVRRSRKYRIQQWGEDCWARIFALFREYNLQRRQSVHGDSTEEEETRRQQRMNVMKDMTKKIRSKERMDAENRWWVAELLAADCATAWLDPEEEETMQKWYVWLEEMEEEDDRRKMEEMHRKG